MFPTSLRGRAFVAYVALLTLLFCRPLARLALYAAHSDLHSHILLVPLVSAYLLLTNRRVRTAVPCRWVPGAVTLGVIGLSAMAAWWVNRGSISVNDGLTLTTLAFVSLVMAGALSFRGGQWMHTAAFPMAFLLFMVPLPEAAVDWLERASALASAEAAALFFAAAGATLVRHGTVFELPGIVLEVAKACSGIRSSWVLSITSVLASYLFLKSPWRRLVLVAFVIPLGILRNGFRIMVIGLLCVHVGPHMIDSVIHRRGGPLFFTLSLVPLFVLLWWLRRGERLTESPGLKTRGSIEAAGLHHE